MAAVRARKRIDQSNLLCLGRANLLLFMRESAIRQIGKISPASAMVYAKTNSACGRSSSPGNVLQVMASIAGGYPPILRLQHIMTPRRVSAAVD